MRSANENIHNNDNKEELQDYRKSKLQTINPTTEQVLKEYEIMSEDQIDDSIKQARNAFLEWKRNIDKRSDFLYAFAKELRKNKEKLAKTATEEMGKAITESRSEIEKCAWVIEYYVRIMEKFFQPPKLLIQMLEKVPYRLSPLES